MTRVRNYGFTLVEVLVTLVLLSFIVSALLTAFRLNGRVWHTIRDQLAEREDTNRVMAFLREEISTMLPVARQTNDARRVLFTGQPDRVEFVGSLPANRESPGLYRLRLFRSQNDLIFSYALLRDDRAAPGKYAAQPLVLLHGVTGIEFRYFGAGTNGQAPQWFDQWPDPAHLPRLMRVSLTGTTPIDEVIAIPADLPPDLNGLASGFVN